MPRKNPKNFIRPEGGEWREIPSGVIEEARHFLNGGTNEQVANYAARVMEIAGPYQAQFREEGPDVSVGVIKTVSGTVPPRAPGDPILTLPEGSRHPGARLVAHYINPDRK